MRRSIGFMGRVVEVGWVGLRRGGEEAALIPSFCLFDLLESTRILILHAC